MQRRKFISFLAGIVAIPACIKALFDKQNEVEVHFQDNGRLWFGKPGSKVYYEQLPGIEPEDKYWVLYKKMEDFVPLPTCGNHPVLVPREVLKNW